MEGAAGAVLTRPSRTVGDRGEALLGAHANADHEHERTDRQQDQKNAADLPALRRRRAGDSWRTCDQRAPAPARRAAQQKSAIIS